MNVFDYTSMLKVQQFHKKHSINGEFTVIWATLNEQKKKITAFG